MAVADVTCTLLFKFLSLTESKGLPTSAGAVVRTFVPFAEGFNQLTKRNRKGKFIYI